MCIFGSEMKVVATNTADILASLSTQLAAKAPKGQHEKITNFMIVLQGKLEQDSPRVQDSVTDSLSNLIKPAKALSSDELTDMFTKMGQIYSQAHPITDRRAPTLNYIHV